MGLHIAYLGYAVLDFLHNKIPTLASTISVYEDTVKTCVLLAVMAIPDGPNKSNKADKSNKSDKSNNQRNNDADNDPDSDSDNDQRNNDRINDPGNACSLSNEEKKKLGELMKKRCLRLVRSSILLLPNFWTGKPFFTGFEAVLAGYSFGLYLLTTPKQDDPTEEYVKPPATKLGKWYWVGLELASVASACWIYWLAPLASYRLQIEPEGLTVSPTAKIDTNFYIDEGKGSLVISLLLQGISWLAFLYEQKQKRRDLATWFHRLEGLLFLVMFRSCLYDCLRSSSSSRLPLVYNSLDPLDREQFT